MESTANNEGDALAKANAGKSFFHVRQIKSHTKCVRRQERDQWLRRIADPNVSILIIHWLIIGPTLSRQYSSVGHERYQSTNFQAGSDPFLIFNVENMPGNIRRIQRGV